MLSPLFRGLFDLDYGTVWRTISSIALVSLAAFSGAWTLLATTWAAAYNAPDRFGTARIEFITYPITWPEREFFAVFAMPTIIVSVWYTSWSSGTPILILLAGVIIGGAGAVTILDTARWVSDRLPAVHPRRTPRRRRGKNRRQSRRHAQSRQRARRLFRPDDRRACAGAHARDHRVRLLFLLCRHRHRQVGASRIRHDGLDARVCPAARADGLLAARA